MSQNLSCQTLVDGTAMLATNAVGSQEAMDVDLDAMIAVIWS